MCSKLKIRILSSSVGKICHELALYNSKLCNSRRDNWMDLKRSTKTHNNYSSTKYVKRPMTQLEKLQSGPVVPFAKSQKRLTTRTNSNCLSNISPKTSPPTAEINNGLLGLIRARHSAHKKKKMTGSRNNCVSGQPQHEHTLLNDKVIKIKYWGKYYYTCNISANSTKCLPDTSNVCCPIILQNVFKNSK